MRYKQLWSNWGWWIASVCAWISVLVCAPLLLPNTYRLSSAHPDVQPLLHNVYLPETATDTTQYRWTQPQSSITWSGLQWGQMAITTVQVADVGSPIDITVNGFATSINGRRSIALLLPPTQVTGQQQIVVQAPTLRVPDDTRILGLRLLSVGLTVGQSPTLAFITVLHVIWLTLMLMGALWLVAIPYWASAALGSPLLALLLIALNPLHAAQWIGGFAAVSTILPLMMYGLRRWIPAGLLVVTGMVYAVRLWGIMYPPFAGHDYAIHLRRLLRFHDGAAILTDNPYEFGQRVSVILPYYYYVADLLSRVIGHHLALHGLMITSETALGVVVWLMLRQQGISARSAQLAGILTLVWPLSTAVLWWAFMPQITAHLLTVVVAYAAVRRDQRGAYLAAICLVLIAAMHVGEFMVAMVWYGLLRLSDLDRWSTSWWRRSVPVLVVAILLPLAYVFIVQSNLPSGSSTSLADLLTTPTRDDVLARMVTAITVAWQPIPLLAAPIIIGIALWRLNRVGWTWLGVGVIFWLIELRTQAQVRYLYTVTPLLSIGLAMTLTPLWHKGRAGRWFVVIIVAFVAWVTFALWVDGVMGWQKPRVDGLTH